MKTNADKCYFFISPGIPVSIVINPSCLPIPILDEERKLT